MTNKEYHEHPAVSKSTLGVIGKSPLHYKYNLENKKDSEAFSFGRACHKWILERNDFFNEFAVLPSVNARTKAGKEELELFKLDNEGKEFVKADEFETIKLMGIAMEQHEVASKLLHGRVEQSFFWTDVDTGVECKCRPDLINDENMCIIDYKTTSSCKNGDFERDARKFSYDLQAAMYTDGVFINELESYSFVFVAQEKTAPFAVRVYQCDEGFVENGREKFREYMETLKYCRDNDEWFGYETELGIVTTLFGE